MLPGALTAEFVFVKHLATSTCTQVMTPKYVKSMPFQINFILHTMQRQRFLEAFRGFLSGF